MSAFPWHLFYLGLGSPVPQTAHRPSPQTFSNPPAFAHTMPVPGCSILPSPKLTLGEHKSFNAAISFFLFSRSFLMLPFPGAWEGKKCLVPDRCPCSVDAQSLWKAVLHCTSESICGLPCLPRGLLTASDLSLSLTQGRHHLQPRTHE